MPFGRYHPASNLKAYDTARLVQVALIEQDASGVELKREQYIIKPAGAYQIGPESVKIHGITTELAEAQGEDRMKVLERIVSFCANASEIVCHNANFDVRVVGSELIRAGLPNVLQDKEIDCTMMLGTDIVKIPKPGNYGGYKWPSITELHTHFFGKAFSNAHSAMADVEACMKCYNKIVGRA